MLTLTGYSNENGDALEIAVEYIDQVTISNAAGVDVTSSLKSAGILTGETSPPDPPEPGGETTLEALVGETFVAPFLVALDAPLTEADWGAL